MARKLEGRGNLGERAAAVLEEPVNRTTTSAVTSQLRREILSGRLKPGQKLRQDELAAAFNTSRIPVREALIALASEGLVMLQANRGGVVAGMSHEELEEIHGIGQALEVLAVERAVPQLLPKELEEMEYILVSMRRRTTTAEEWYELNHRFHFLLVRACGWPMLVRLIERWREHMGRYITGFGAFGANRKLWDKEHQSILEACRRRNGRSAAKLVREHWRKSYEVLERSFGSLGEPKTETVSETSTRARRSRKNKR